MNDKSTMKMLLEARFQQLAEDQKENNEMPSKLKKEVFRTLDMLDVFGDITDLFTGKFGESTAEFIDLIDDPKSTDLTEE